MSILKSIAGRIQKFFLSGKAASAIDVAVALVPRALPIIQVVAALTPTRSDDEIVAAFAKYGVPLADSWKTLPRSERGYALLHLATEVLSSQSPAVGRSIINAAVQLAVTAQKAKDQP